MNQNRPKNQEELRSESIKGSPSPVDNIRAKQTRAVKGEDLKELVIEYKDIDEAIAYYIQNQIRPTVVHNGNSISVPVRYASPERWSEVQRQGYLKDREGQTMLPLLVLRRTEQAKLRVNNKLDANNPVNYIVSKKKYNRKNVYDNFSVLNGLENRDISKKYVVTVIPDYYVFTYEISVWTYTINQINKIQEALMYAENSYWGNKEEFVFRTKIDTTGQTVDVTTGNERLVRSTMTAKVYCYLLPETYLRDIAKQKIVYGPAKLSINFELVENIESNTFEEISKMRDSGGQTNEITVQETGTVEGGGSLD